MSHAHGACGRQTVAPARDGEPEDGRVRTATGQTCSYCLARETQSALAAGVVLSLVIDEI